MNTVTKYSECWSHALVPARRFLLGVVVLLGGVLLAASLGYDCVQLFLIR